jgi:hypothetical protein
MTSAHPLSTIRGADDSDAHVIRVEGELTCGTGEVSRRFRLTMLDLTLPFIYAVDGQASAMTPERVRA